MSTTRAKIYEYENTQSLVESLLNDRQNGFSTDTYKLIHQWVGGIQKHWSPDEGSQTRTGNQIINGILQVNTLSSSISDSVLVEDSGVFNKRTISPSVWDGGALDSHLGDSSIHFTEASIDHTAIQNIGVNTHSQIDTHIADNTIHSSISALTTGYIPYWDGSVWGDSPASVSGSTISFDGSVIIDGNAYFDCGSTGTNAVYITRFGTSNQGLKIYAVDKDLYMRYIEDSGEPAPGTWHFYIEKDGGPSYEWLRAENDGDARFYYNLSINGSLDVGGALDVGGNVLIGNNTGQEKIVLKGSNGLANACEIEFQESNVGNGMSLLYNSADNYLEVWDNVDTERLFYIHREGGDFNYVGSGVIGGDFAVTGIVTGSNLNISDWDTAHNHTLDGSIHFTEASIDHTAIQNIGTHTHTQIDSHIADNTIHSSTAAMSTGYIPYWDGSVWADSPMALFDGGIGLSGPLVVDGSATVRNNLTVDDDIYNSNLRIYKDIPGNSYIVNQVGAELSIISNTVGSNYGSLLLRGGNYLRLQSDSGAVRIYQSSFRVDGTSLFGDTVTVNALLDVNGNADISGTLDVSGNVTIKGSLYLDDTDLSIYHSYDTTSDVMNFKASDSNNYGNFKWYSEKRDASDNRLVGAYIGDRKRWEFYEDVGMSESLAVTERVEGKSLRATGNASSSGFTGDSIYLRVLGESDSEILAYDYTGSHRISLNVDCSDFTIDHAGTKMAEFTQSKNYLYKNTDVIGSLDVTNSITAALVDATTVEADNVDVGSALTIGGSGNVPIKSVTEYSGTFADTFEVSVYITLPAEGRYYLMLQVDDGLGWLTYSSYYASSTNYLQLDQYNSGGGFVEIRAYNSEGKFRNKAYNLIAIRVS